LHVSAATSCPISRELWGRDARDGRTVSLGWTGNDALIAEAAGIRRNVDLEGDMAGQTNSMLTRVRPVFGWLRENGGEFWPEQLVRMAGITDLKQFGRLLRMKLEAEQEVPPTRERLFWMLQNVERLAPVDGRRWEKLRATVINRDQVRNVSTTLIHPGSTFRLDSVTPAGGFWVDGELAGTEVFALRA
jgi:hypothetical protein